jgi:hypothetical protein
MVDASRGHVYLTFKVQCYLRAAAWLGFKHVLMQTPPSSSKGKERLPLTALHCDRGMTAI